MTLNPFELGRLSFDRALDSDGDLCVEIECDCYISTYLTSEQLTKLRDHLDGLLKKPEAARAEPVLAKYVATSLMSDLLAKAWDEGFAQGIAECCGMGAEPNPYKEVTQ